MALPVAVLTAVLLWSQLGLPRPAWASELNELRGTLLSIQRGQIASERFRLQSEQARTKDEAYQRLLRSRLDDLRREEERLDKKSGWGSTE
jgi:hypothetical protein